MTARALIDATAARLAAAGVDSPRRAAEWLVEDVTGLPRTAAYTGAAVAPDAAARVTALAERRAAGEPLQYVLGHADFYGLRLRVTPDVLIPRPETEEVVEAVLAGLRDVVAPWVLDVGTGSGAIALAIQHERPDAHVVAADVSAAALAVARANADALDLPVAWIEADAFVPAFAGEVPPLFHAIVSNPPYVPASEEPSLQREVRDHEPALALFVDDADPLAPYRALAGHAARLLVPGGWLVAETHADFGAAVARLWADAGLADAVVRPDLAGRDRIALARRAPDDG